LRARALNAVDQPRFNSSNPAIKVACDPNCLRLSEMWGFNGPDLVWFGLLEVVTMLMRDKSSSLEPRLKIQNPSFRMSNKVRVRH
jgi:hypothetical protein